ncbi:uncharacterized protein LOC106160908 [Lingula anatina]|uniref:Uncharacterized protein LOC106160908 n=1 Tax=Lingula anatina TaxID=7574 RepID=A0A1S3I6Z1_LINAN|nr:uncharacterized protein LOC106160908 [Lingula anatina]|eukprot:XP_013393134.1 uncharacterized protein LOC106160908 [Lingula anatina]
MRICGIVGCPSNSNKEKGLRFYKIPRIIKNQGEETRRLSEERRRLWKAAVNRKDIRSEEKWDRTTLCAKHFVDGEKAYLHDRLNPSWLPTLNLGYTACTVPESAMRRYERAVQRKERKKLSDAAPSLSSPKKPRLASKSGTFAEDSHNGINSLDPSLIAEVEVKVEPQDSNLEIHNSTSNTKETQTELTAKDIENIENDNRARVAEAGSKPPFGRHGLYSFEAYENNPDKISFYTGLPSFETLKLVFDYVEAHMTETRSLTKEAQFMLCLIKLKMNYTIQDIAYQLDVSHVTVYRHFYSTLNLLHQRLGFIVKWPDRETLTASMPATFKEDFGDKVLFVFDSFELSVEKPNAHISKVCGFSSNTCPDTVKYLIGISPQGTVTCVSESCNFETSDRQIAEESGMLDNFQPGDFVMIDKRFSTDTAESFNLYQAELAGTTSGKIQLCPLDVKKKRKIAGLKIRTGRLIGLICSKFKIFDNIPAEYLKVRSGESEPNIDKILKICCCLTNLCPSAVSYD